MVRVGGFDKLNWPEDTVQESRASWPITYNVLRDGLWEWATQIQSASRSVAKYALLAKLPDLLSLSAGSCCFCIHLAETGELLSGTCWMPALPLVPSTLRLRWCWPGLHNASGFLHSMALNGVVKLVCHTHHTNIILMDPLCCRLQFVPVFYYNAVKWEWRQLPEVLWTGYYLCVSEMSNLFIS